MSDELFYLQDSRSYVGNDMLWWASGGNGYTTDLRAAHVYTKTEAVAKHQMRESDIPWPKHYIDSRTRQVVDAQIVNRSLALEGTGITLRKPQKQRPDSYRCNSCQCFISAHQAYLEPCPRCGADNKP